MLLETVRRSLIQPKLQERFPCNWIGLKKKKASGQDWQLCNRSVKKAVPRQAGPHSAKPPCLLEGALGQKGIWRGQTLLMRSVHVLAC